MFRHSGAADMHMLLVIKDEHGSIFGAFVTPHGKGWAAAPGTFLFCLHSVRNATIQPHKMLLVDESAACVNTQGCGLHIGKGTADLTLCGTLARVKMNVTGSATGFVAGPLGAYVSAAAEVATAEIEAFVVTF